MTASRTSPFQGYKYDSNLQPVANNLQVLNGNGDGTFVLGTPYTFDSPVGAILVADLNGDKRSDLIVSLGAKNVPGALPRRVILSAKQTTGFYWSSTITHNEQWGVIDGSSLGGSLLNNSSAGTLVDLNHDGKPDLALSNSPGPTKDPSYLEILGGEGGTSICSSPHHPRAQPHRWRLGRSFGQRRSHRHPDAEAVHHHRSQFLRAPYQQQLTPPPALVTSE